MSAENGAFLGKPPNIMHPKDSDLGDNFLSFLASFPLSRIKLKYMYPSISPIYHTIMEVFNILYNNSSEQINKKYRHQDRHSHRKKHQ